MKDTHGHELNIGDIVQVWSLSAGYVWARTVSFNPDDEDGECIELLFLKDWAAPEYTWSYSEDQIVWYNSDYPTTTHTQYLFDLFGRGPKEALPWR